MKLGYKFRIYPTKIQQGILASEFGNARYIWNNLLSNAKETKWDWLSASKHLTKMREELDWLKQGNRSSQQQVVNNLKDGFNRFFKKQNKYPTFKSKYDNQSIRYSESIKLGEDWIGCAPKLGLGQIKCKITRDIPETPKQITISKVNDKYYVSFCVETPNPEPMEPIRLGIGLDVGHRKFLTDSEGNQIDNPKWLDSKLNKLKKYQQMVSRRKKTSNRRRKAKYKLGVLHTKISNTRKDFLHKISTKITNENQVVVVEKLLINEMPGGKVLNRNWRDVGNYMFREMLKYKSKRIGREYIEINPKYTSKRCSTCGEINKKLGGQEEWTCPSCQTNHNRDINAAINIIRQGLPKSTHREISNGWSMNCEITEVKQIPLTMCGV